MMASVGMISFKQKKILFFKIYLQVYKWIALKLGKI
jgi:hypothetical protein